MRVLIADPSLQMCERLEAVFLDIPGLTVVGKSHSVHDTVKMINKLKPDVVILEIQMNDGGGCTFVRQVKREMFAPVVVILTNFSASQYRKDFLDAGADFYFDKSFEFEKAVEVLEELQISVLPSESQEFEMS